VGTYGYMPPEQFGGAATAASDLYSLGATLITLATGIQPADLPQEDMRIAFEKVVNLTPSFAEWLGWLVEPSLDKRVSSAEIVLKALETGQMIQVMDKPEAVRKYEPIDTLELFWHIMWRSGFVGSGVTILAAALYGTAIFPGAGTFIGGLFGIFVGIPLSLANGLLVGIITRLFFYPLGSTSRHRRTTVLLSTLISTVLAVNGFESMNMGGSVGLIPSVISGLSMGVATKSFARWYDSQSGLRRR
ncbi:MAG: serine/threonine protein kinase, partial [Cyanobacteriota bacterium]|nr:serine/threonine protein kinase [Cyanobacteriota bacterium]